MRAAAPSRGILRPLDSDTRGLGEAIAAALDLGARELAIGVGGSASQDAGLGALGGLGVRVLDARGLAHVTEVLERVTGRAVRDAPGMGAAGGVPAGLASVTGASPVSGADFMINMLELPHGSPALTWS